jgi:hypothetical protein
VAGIFTLISRHRFLMTFDGKITTGMGGSAYIKWGLMSSIYIILVLYRYFLKKNHI